MGMLQLRAKDGHNLSAYMVAAKGSNDYICLDAGTLHAGIQQAINKGAFKVPLSTVLRQYIKEQRSVSFIFYDIRRWK